MVRTSPTVAGWELMLRIRARRDERGVNSKAITQALGISPQYWSQLVKGKGVLAEDKLQVLMELLEFEPDEQRELLALRSVAKSRGWWSAYSALFDDELLRYYGLEEGAQSIRSVEGGVIPGLLQSEDYIRALMSSIVSTGRPTEAEQRVRARLHRQRRLSEDEPLRLSVVIGQSALLQQVGGPDVQRDQLRHLLDLIDRHPENLVLRVVPFDARGSVAGLNAATFHLLDFGNSRLPVLGWLETAIYGQIVEDSKQVEALDYLYNQFTSVAMSREDSMSLIKQTSSTLG